MPEPKSGALPLGDWTIYLGKAGAAPAIHERELDLQSNGFADSLLTLVLLLFQKIF